MFRAMIVRSLASALAQAPMANIATTPTAIKTRRIPRILSSLSSPARSSLSAAGR